MAQAFAGVVVQIDMAHFDIAGRKTRGVHRKPVVLRGDLDLARGQILHRMVAAAMAEFELECFSAER